jgi:hypothetical protein
MESSVQKDQQDALFASSLLRLIASTYFEHLFAHHLEALYIQHFVYTVPPGDYQINAQNF